MRGKIFQPTKTFCSTMPPATRAYHWTAAQILSSVIALLTASHASAAAGLRDAVLLYAPFDGGLDATIAAGDPKLYTASTGNRAQARPGLPDDDLVLHERGAGRFGDSLRFT